MSLLKSSAVQFALAAAGISSAWLLLDRVNTGLAALPVQQVERATDLGAASDLPEIFPVWVAPRRTKPVAQEGGSVDEAFQGVAEPAAEEEAPVAAPTYAESLTSALKVQGTAGSGAFLNGRFYPIGADIQALSVVGPDGSQVIPRLCSVSSQRVVVTIAGERIAIAKGDAAWP